LIAAHCSFASLIYLISYLNPSVPDAPTTTQCESFLFCFYAFLLCFPVDLWCFVSETHFSGRRFDWLRSSSIFVFVFLFLIGSVVFCMMLSSFFFLCRFYRETSVVMLLSNSFISCGQRDSDDLTVRVFLFLFSVSFLLLIHQIYSEKYQFSFNMVLLNVICSIKFLLDEIVIFLLFDILPFILI
jgi:hypothetical protein